MGREIGGWERRGDQVGETVISQAVIKIRGREK